MRRRRLRGARSRPIRCGDVSGVSKSVFVLEQCQARHQAAPKDDFLSLTMHRRSLFVRPLKLLPNGDQQRTVILQVRFGPRQFANCPSLENTWRRVPFRAAVRLGIFNGQFRTNLSGVLVELGLELPGALGDFGGAWCPWAIGFGGWFFWLAHATVSFATSVPGSGRVEANGIAPLNRVPHPVVAPTADTRLAFFAPPNV